jgi:methionyl-tRNA formyltransferase
VCAALGSLGQSIVIFCGPGGAIGRGPLFATGKRFLHMHPGRLPDYRGSTTIYYSLLSEGRIAVSALFLDPAIDAGPVVAVKEFEPPHDRTLIDHVFDPYIRAQLLVEVLEDYRATGGFAERPQSREEGNTFYIIHPVLKHLAILGKRTPMRSGGA